MREIVIDTETTGLDPQTGHRVVEIAALELVNHLPTGKVYHTYVNPERGMPEAAFAIHGLTAEFLASSPVFGAVAGEFLAFIAGATLVIHNAEFDLAFINAELARLGFAALAGPVIDTLTLARRRFPGQPASLDALCRRYNIDLSVRERHGARIDGELLAAVYLELIGGRQPGLDLAAAAAVTATLAVVPRSQRPARPHAPSPEELMAHAALVAKLREPLWRSLAA